MDRKRPPEQREAELREKAAKQAAANAGPPRE